MPLSADSRCCGDLFHPESGLSFVEILQRFQFDAASRLAHPGRGDGRHGVEQRRAVDEHELDVADEGTAAEAPASRMP